MFKHKLLIAILLSLSVILISCNNPTPKSNKSAEIKKSVKPIADSEVAIVELEQPTFGKFTIELYSNIAPELVKRFKALATEGFYNGTTFHRINEKVIQGGDPLTKDNNPENDGTGKSKLPDVIAEFSDIPYDTGIVGAARGPDPNSNNSQFFVTLRRAAEFDQKYTIFGKVVEGMNNVRIIGGVPRDGERPLDEVKIKSITIETRK